MLGVLDRRLGDWIAWVVGASSRRPRAVVLGAVALALAAVATAAGHLGVNADTADVFSEELEFRQLRDELERVFPMLADGLLVVVDAASEAEATRVAEQLADRLARDEALYDFVWAPGAGSFFRRQGLLYLETDELYELADHLAAAQPFLAALSRDPSLRGLVGQLATALERDAVERAGGPDLTSIFEGLAGAVREAEDLHARAMPFGDLLLRGEAPEDGSARRFVLAHPRLDWGEFVAGSRAIEGVARAARELGYGDGSGVSVRVTGELALETEELSHVRRQAGAAGVASFLLVAAILWVALGSPRLIAAAILTLLVGLAWTAGFAALAVGHLNLISVAFAVLFIGLGIDFGIHFTTRYQELRLAGDAHAAGLRGAARSVGASLTLCALSTALGFYAFAPTGFRGVAELGMISGTGMLICLLASLTVLPAALSWGAGAEAVPRSGRTLRLPALPARHPRAVLAVTLALAGLAALLAPRLRFDANPLHVRDPGAESVQVFEELVERGDVNPWSIEVLMPSLAAAEALGERIEALPSVARVVTLADYVPEEQDEKLEVLADVQLFLQLAPEPQAEAATAAEELAALARLRDGLRGFEPDNPALAEAAARLRRALDEFLAADPARREAAVQVLRETLVEPIAWQIDRLRAALEAQPMDQGDLPEELTRQLVTEEGRARLQVFPEEDLNDPVALRRFVREVRSEAPRATGASVYMFDSAETIVASLTQAFAAAAVAITLLLLLLWRSVADTALALAPLLLAALLTAATSVVVGLPINFANVIVLPLLLGIGVDSGIHLVHRQRHEGAAARDLLATSTSRAVLWSALTTIASFGSLGFATHRGMATLGQLLTLGVVFTVACNLLVLPAILAWLESRRTKA